MTTTTTGLRKRTVRFTGPILREYPKLRGFHMPQRDHVKYPMPERVEKGNQ